MSHLRPIPAEKKYTSNVGQLSCSDNLIPHITLLHDVDSNNISLETHLQYIRLTCDGLEIHVTFKTNTSRKEIYK